MEKIFFKTGVSSDTRKFTRILEQGAITTLYFAACDGYTSRKIENFVSRNLKIKQAVTYDQKLKNILNEIDEATARAKSGEMYSHLKEIFPDEFKYALLEKEEFYYNLPLFDLQLDEKTDSVFFINEIESGDQISGKIIGTYGDIIFLDNENKIFALHGSSLAGYEIENHNEQTQLKIQPKEIKLLKDQFENISMF